MRKKFRFVNANPPTMFSLSDVFTLYQFTVQVCLWRNGFQQFELLIYIFQARWSPNGPWGDPLNTYLV